MEDKNGFKDLMEDIMALLFERGKIKTTQLGYIALAGQGGGYRSIAYILMRGGLNDYIREVYLFDALHGQLEKFVFWFDHYNGKLINLYSSGGGTEVETKNLIEDLKGWGTGYIARSWDELSDSELKVNRLIFIKTEFRHADIIDKAGGLQRLLKASIFEEM